MPHRGAVPHRLPSTRGTPRKDRAPVRGTNMVDMNWMLHLLLAAIQGAIGLGIADTRQWFRRQTFIEKPSELGLHWNRLALLGTLMLFGTFQLVRAIVEIMGRTEILLTIEPQIEARLTAEQTLWILVLFGGPLFFLVGGWMGRRSLPQLSIATGALCVIASGVVCVLADIVLRAINTDLLEFMIRGVSFWVFIWSPTMFVLIPALCGYLHGRRRFSGAYLAYILRNVPEHTRSTIVDLAYEEAIKSTRQSEN